ncbi:MAG: tRNA pseudouridine(38-40) synthase TruA [Thermomicrobiales bacterium]|nr:tRNA pseudouridine(38-40) synthase TruA [Thermomicrobiales bacterium]
MTLKLTIAYDGTNFVGSQRQKNGRSVQEDLETAVSGLFGQTAKVELAGRTDSGVHAVGQVASLWDGRPGMSDARVIEALNALLADDLAVVGCQRESETFHARYDAKWREYRYRIWWGVHQPLLRQQVWQRWPALDLEAMAEGAARLTGEVDLASFAGNGVGVDSSLALGRRGTVRNIMHCSVYPVQAWWGTAPAEGHGAEIRIIADGFLPQVVRTVAGALADVGRKKRPPSWISELIEVADRRQGPQTAPPQGLMLWRVGYGDDAPEPDPVSWRTGDRNGSVSGNR